MSDAKYTKEPWREEAARRIANVITSTKCDLIKDGPAMLGHAVLSAICEGFVPGVRSVQECTCMVDGPECPMHPPSTVLVPAEVMAKVREALEEAYADAVFARDASIIPNQQKRHGERADRARNALRLLAQTQHQEKE